jgi:hypothetical protein
MARIKIRPAGRSKAGKANTARAARALGRLPGRNVRAGRGSAYKA